MAVKDIYQDLYEMYSIFNIHLVEDTIRELMRVQFTPEEADLAVRIGFSGGKLF